MVTAYFGLLLLVGAERLLELHLSRRHAQIALAAGGIEVGQSHFTAMKVLHTSFLVACALEVGLAERPFHPTLAAVMLAATIGAQVLRYVAIATLGDAWNVRVIVVPGRPAVQRGIYRYLRHPNYVAVAIEGVALPMIHGAWVTAVLFTILNALLLRVRIACEEEALERYCDYAPRLGSTRRFVPRWPSKLSQANGL